MPIQLPISPEVLARPLFPSNPPDLVGSFFAGQDLYQKQQERNLFSQGLPRDAAGNVDWNQVAEQLARVQGAGAIGALGGLRTADIQQKALENIGKMGPLFPTAPGPVQHRPDLEASQALVDDQGIQPGTRPGALDGKQPGREWHPERAEPGPEVGYQPR